MFTTLRTLFSSSTKVFKYNDDLIAFTLPGEWLREDEPSVRVSLLNDRTNTRYMVSLLRVREPMPSREEKL